MRAFRASGWESLCICIRVSRPLSLFSPRVLPRLIFEPLLSGSNTLLGVQTAFINLSHPVVCAFCSPTYSNAVLTLLVCTLWSSSVLFNDSDRHRGNGSAPVSLTVRDFSITEGYQYTQSTGRHHRGHNHADNHSLDHAQLWPLQHI